MSFSGNPNSKNMKFKSSFACTGRKNLNDKSSLFDLFYSYKEFGTYLLEHILPGIFEKMGNFGNTNKNENKKLFNYSFEIIN